MESLKYKIYQKLPEIRELFINYYGKSKEKIIDEVLDNSFFFTYNDMEYRFYDAIIRDDDVLLNKLKEQLNKEEMEYDEAISEERSKIRKFIKEQLGSSYFRDYEYQVPLEDPNFVSDIRYSEDIAKMKIFEKMQAVEIEMLDKVKMKLAILKEEFANNLEMIRALNLEDKDYPIKLSLLEQSIGSFTPNFINGKRVNIILIDMSRCNSIYCTLLHEINHAYETYTEYLTDRFFYKTGFTSMMIPILQEETPPTNDVVCNMNEFDYFNEITNEIISSDIMIVSDKDFYIDSHIQSKRIQSAYYAYESLAKKFIDRYRKILIEYRREPSLDPIYNIVGRDNFNDLNRIIYEYSKNISLPSHKKINIQEYETKADKVLKKMIEYEKIH